MVRIRFRRVGARNQPSYRIVAADKRNPRDGRFLEAFGHYNPRTEPATVVVDEARLFHWLENGAQLSESVSRTLKGIGSLDRWERYKAGEDIDVLLKEAALAVKDVDQRTRRDDLMDAAVAAKAAARAKDAGAKAAAGADEEAGA